MLETEDRIYFWDGIFSNFHPICGNDAITSEKFFMMGKAATFDDPESMYKIAVSKSPMAAKRLGRKVKSFDPEIWDDIKENAMSSALLHKFGICEDFREALKESGEKMLVEASPYDRIWGIGFDEDNAEGNEADWGENLLGKCLMKVRESMYGK